MSKDSTTPVHTPHRIIVIRQHDQLGDMLCAVPLLRAIRQAYPRSLVTLVTSPVNHQIMLHHPYVDEVINYEKKSFFTTSNELWNFCKSLLSKNYDMAIVPATVSLSRTSDLIALLSGAKVRIGAERLGDLSNSTKWCFSKKVTLDWSGTPRRHQALRNLDILAPIDITTEDLSCVIGLTEEEKIFGKNFLEKLRAGHTCIVGMHPGAGKSENRWPADRFAAIANQLSTEYSAAILVTKGPMDDLPVAEFISQLNCPYTLVELQPIRKVAAIIDQLDIMLSNDTGIMHIAGAVSPKTLALFGPTDPLEWAPIGSKNRFIAAEDKNISSLAMESVHRMLEVMLHTKA